MKMKNTLLLAVLFTGFFVSCQKELTVVPEEETAITSEDSNDVTISSNSKISGQIPVYNNVGNNIGGFLAALPYNYHSTTKNYPLLITIHGIGQLGNGASQLYRVTFNGIPALIQKGKFPSVIKVNGEEFSFIVISPQFKRSPTPDDVVDMIEYAKKKYRVDANRIYLTGLSMGGGTVMKFASVYPEKVAAVIPMAGSYRCSDANADKVAKADLPVWGFHNQRDPRVNPENTIRFIDLINSHKPKTHAKKTIFMGVHEHNCWAKASDPHFQQDHMNIYEWMLQYKIGWHNNNTSDNSGKGGGHKPDHPKGNNDLPSAVIRSNVTSVALPKEGFIRINLNGTRSEGRNLSFKWMRKGSAPDVGFSNPDGAITTAKFTHRGVYTIQLEVTDSHRNSAVSYITITVR